jgi:hypothetical protein
MRQTEHARIAVTLKNCSREVCGSNPLYGFLLSIPRNAVGFHSSPDECLLVHCNRKLSLLYLSILTIHYRHSNRLRLENF